MAAKDENERQIVTFVDRFLNTDGSKMNMKELSHYIHSFRVKTFHILFPSQNQNQLIK